MAIPLVDLRIQYEELRDEVMAAFEEALDGMQLVLGPNVQGLEAEWSEYCGVPHSIGMANGTEALALALRALGVGPGDEVITVSFTFIASIECLYYLGAKPVLVDIDPDTFCISPERLAEAITPRTRAVIPVHLYGHSADMDGISEAIGDRDIVVLEDAAQAHGARYKGARVGSLGDAGAFSFYLSKNLAAYGEGGMVTTADEEVAETIRKLRVHGSLERYRHEMIGFNSRLHELQAAVLRIKLRRLDDWNEARRRHAARYDEQLADIVTTPMVADWAEHVYHLYTIRSPRRDEIAEALAATDISYGIYYRVPSHLQEALSDLGMGPGSLPETERAADEVLALPMYPELTDDQIDEVCAVVRGALL